MNKKYQLIITVPLEEIDDFSVRVKVKEILEEINLSQDIKIKIKIHEIYDNKPPRSLKI